jgi:hypothetical protein
MPNRFSTAKSATILLDANKAAMTNKLSCSKAKTFSSWQNFCLLIFRSAVGLCLPEPHGDMAFSEISFAAGYIGI